MINSLSSVGHGVSTPICNSAPAARTATYNNKLRQGHVPPKCCLQGQKQWDSQGLCPPTFNNWSLVSAKLTLYLIAPWLSWWSCVLCFFFFLLNSMNAYYLKLTMLKEMKMTSSHIKKKINTTDTGQWSSFEPGPDAAGSSRGIGCHVALPLHWLTVCPRDPVTLSPSNCDPRASPTYQTTLLQLSTTMTSPSLLVLKHIALII